MPVSSRIDREKDLTILTFPAEISEGEILSAIRAFWEGSVTLNVLADMRGASGRRLAASDLESVANSVAEFSKNTERRMGGKTAIVAPADFGFGLARMFDIFRGLRGIPFELEVFRSIEDASDWLEGR